MRVSVLGWVHSIAEHQPYGANRRDRSLRLVEHVCLDRSSLIYFRCVSSQGDALGAYSDGDGANLVRGMAPTGDNPDDYGNSGQMGIQCVRLHRGCNDGGATDTLHFRSKAAVAKPTWGTRDERQQRYDDGSTRGPRDADELRTCMKKTGLLRSSHGGFEDSCVGEEFRRGGTIWGRRIIQHDSDSDE